MTEGKHLDIWHAHDTLTGAPFAVNHTLAMITSLNLFKQQALHELPLGGQAHPGLDEEALLETQPGNPQRRVPGGLAGLQRRQHHPRVLARALAVLGGQVLGGVLG